MWASLGTVAQALSQITAIVLLARLLSPAEFGVVSSALLITQLLMIFADLGSGVYIVQRLKLNEQEISTAKTIALCSSIVCATVLAASSSYWASIFKIDQLSSVLKVYCLQLALLGLTAAHDARLQRELQFRYLAIADAVSYIIGYLFISVACAYHGLSYWSLVIGHLSQSLLRSVFILLKTGNWFSFSWQKTLAMEIVHFGFGQSLSRVGSLLASQADSYVVTTKLGVEAIGIYGRANQLATMPASQLGQIFDKVLFPLIAREQELKQGKDTYLRAIQFVTLLSLPPSIFLYWAAADIVHLALGPGWSAVGPVMQTLSLAIPLRLLHKVSDPAARALGATYRRAWRQWLVACCMLITAYIASPFGMVAVAGGVVIVCGLDALLLLMLCCSSMKIKYRKVFMSLLPGLFAGIISLLVFWNIYRLEAGTSLFGINLFLLSGVSCILLTLSFTALMRFAWRRYAFL